LVAAYYFGAMFGCFFAGWFGDAYGRKKGVWFGSLWCILGGALMSASQNSNMFICARVIAGIGIGFINTLIPPWVSELAKAHSRGVNFTFVFISNCECVCPAQFHFG
jgi:MFS family permease